MGMTASQKIIAAHCGKRQVEAGEIVMAQVDLALANDVTAPVAIAEFEKAGLDHVFDPQRIALVMDHFTPNKDIKAAQQCKRVRAFAERHAIGHFYEGGQAGVEHALLPEKGLVAPGDLIVGADSHTCTYGALGAFATGVGSTDLAAAMAAGQAWLRVPQAISVIMEGSLPAGVGGKDLALALIGLLGVDGALYQSLEFSGPGAASLSVDDRLCVCNMAIECGAKNGFFTADEKAAHYLQAHGAQAGAGVQADRDAAYTRVIRLDLSQLQPVVAFPHLPSNVHAVADIKADIAIDQVVVGSCTNGRLSDLRAAAHILRGRSVHPGVRCLIIPATQQIYLDALREGLLEDFITAGCLVSAPTCGPCLGGHMGILAAGERCVATTNRNFVGRMGDPASEVYLAGPQVAAASAVLGKIAGPASLGQKEVHDAL